jgi:anti-sigma factor RsiW
VSVSDDAALIARYLLHELPAAEREAIERRYLSDPEYLELLEAVEGDLIDAYVRGELPEKSRERFERYFLCTRARQERVRLAEALIEHVPSRRSWRREWIAVGVVSVLAVIWVCVETGALARRHVDAGRGRPALHAVVLAPFAAPQTIDVPRDGENVRIDVLVDEEGEWPDLRASLRGDDGREMWSATNLQLDAARTVRLSIPASSFARGRHQLVLTSGVEIVGDHSFFAVTRGATLSFP